MIPVASDSSSAVLDNPYVLMQVLAHFGVASSLLVALPVHAHVPTDVVANIATTIPGEL